MLEFATDLDDMDLLLCQRLNQTWLLHCCGLLSKPKGPIEVGTPCVDSTVLCGGHREAVGTADLLNSIDLVSRHIKPKYEIFNKSRSLSRGRADILDAKFSALVASKGVQ